MLQTLGDKFKGTGEGGGAAHRWVWYLIIGALILVFAAWGAYGVVDLSFGQSSYAVKVNGESISSEEMNDQWQRQLPQLMEAFGGDLTEAQRREFQQQLVSIKVRELATTQHARKVGFRISDQQLGRAFREEEAFQIDGQFSIQEARARLLNQGISEQAYLNDLRKRITSNQLLGAIGVSDFLTPAEGKRLLALLDEEREVRYLLLDPERYAGNEPVTAEAIQAYYDSHKDEFAVPESVRLAYAELSLADIAGLVNVTDAELQARYDQDKSQYVQAETRNARHILIAVDEASQDAAKAAEAKALYDQIKGGADFAELAKKSSQDSASARNGGELGWASRETYAPAFAEKLFSMQPGDVSEPVKTEFGYHIIKLEGVRPQTGRDFAAVREEIATVLRNEKAIALFGSEQDRLQEQLESANANFDAVVKEFNMRRGEVANFERGAGGLPLGSDAELNREVFGDAVLTQRRIGGPVQLAEDRITIFRVEDHRPASVRSLDEVRGEITTAVIRERGAAAALAAAEQGAKDLATGRTFEQVAAALKVKPEPTRFVARSAPDLPVELRDALFVANRPEPSKPLRKVVKLEDGGVALLESTTTRVAAQLDMPQLITLRTQRELQRYTRREIEAYIDQLVKSAKVRENPAAFVQ